jgi:protein-L-isoaspartate O-methyltransferase
MNDERVRRLSRESFEAQYASTEDPWKFETSPYEQSRYGSILRALSRGHYAAVYEPGCSIGVLTAKLAAIADQVIATDIASRAISRAHSRCEDLPNVALICDDVTTFTPGVAPDLLVFSEIGYYFDAGELTRTARRLAGFLHPHGEFVAAHWLGSSAEHILHGDEVHEILKACLPLNWVKGERYARFRIDCWAKS